MTPARPMATHRQSHQLPRTPAAVLSNLLATDPASREFHVAPLRLSIAARSPRPAGRPLERASPHLQPTAPQPQPVRPRAGRFWAGPVLSQAFFAPVLRRPSA